MAGAIPKSVAPDDSSRLVDVAFRLHSRFLEWLLLVGLILAYGAVFAGLGLIMSICSRRPAWALAWSLGIYFLAAIAPCFDPKENTYVDFVSPLRAVVRTSFQVVNVFRGCTKFSLVFPQPPVDPELVRRTTELILRQASISLLILGIIGCLLLLVAVKSFDRCMGRIPEHAGRTGLNRGPSDVNG